MLGFTSSAQPTELSLNKEYVAPGIGDHRHVAMVGYSVVVRMAHATLAVYFGLGVL